MLRDKIEEIASDWKSTGEAVRKHAGREALATAQQLIDHASELEAILAQEPEVAPTDVEKIAREAQNNVASKNDWFRPWEKGSDFMRKSWILHCSEILRHAGLAPDPDMVAVSRKKAVQFLTEQDRRARRGGDDEREQAHGFQVARCAFAAIGLSVEPVNESQQEKDESAADEIANSVMDRPSWHIRDAVKAGIEWARKGQDARV